MLSCSEPYSSCPHLHFSDIAVFDPIDGSKNIDASLPVGSIFGIYKKRPGTEVDFSTFLQDGRSLVAAGYCLFS